MAKTLVDDLNSMCTTGVVPPPLPNAVLETTVGLLSDIQDVATFVKANSLCFDMLDDALAKVASLGTTDNICKMAIIQQKARRILAVLGGK